MHLSKPVLSMHAHRNRKGRGARRAHGNAHGLANGLVAKRKVDVCHIPLHNLLDVIEGDFAAGDTGLGLIGQRKVKDKANPRDATPIKQPAETLEVSRRLENQGTYGVYN